MKIPGLSSLLARFSKAAPSEEAALQRIDSAVAIQANAIDDEIGEAERQLTTASDATTTAKAALTQLTSRVEQLQAQRVKSLEDDAASVKRAAAAFAAGGPVDRVLDQVQSTAGRFDALLAAVQPQVAEAEAAVATAEAREKAALKRVQTARCRQAEIAWDVAGNQLAYAASRLFQAYGARGHDVPSVAQTLWVPFFSGERSLLAHLEGRQGEHNTTWVLNASLGWESARRLTKQQEA